MRVTPILLAIMLSTFEVRAQAAGDRGAAMPTMKGWVISETTSPVDYRPQISATLASQSGARSTPASLTVSCRGGRTQVVIGTAEAPSQEKLPPADIVYRVDDSRPLVARGAFLKGGAEIAVSGNVVAVLRSWPDEGVLRVSVYDPRKTQEWSFQLAGFREVQRRVAAACAWPDDTGNQSTSQAGRGRP